MTISQAQTTSFLAELYSGTHVLTTDVIKIALYTSSANLGYDTTAYSSTNEITGSGYSAGGATMSGAVIVTSDDTAYVDFADVSWSGALTARGALIYNSSKANRSVAVLDFGMDRTSTTAFTVTMPVAAATTALVRSAS